MNMNIRFTKNLLKSNERINIAFFGAQILVSITLYVAFKRRQMQCIKEPHDIGALLQFACTFYVPKYAKRAFSYVQM